MKKIFRALTLCLVLLSLLCAAVPAAFAAGNKEDAFYTIGLDACGGVSSTVVVTTNLDGKLTTLPESPTMDGYTFCRKKSTLFSAQGALFAQPEEFCARFSKNIF